jgi:hypothetical protein
VSDPGPLVPLLATLRDLAAWLEAAKAPYLVIGGVAVSLIGRPRVTADVDAVVLLPEADWENLARAGKSFGMVPRLEDALAFARKARILLMHHQPSGIDVDVAFGALPFEEEAISRAVSTKVASLTLPLPTPEDLIVMKAVAGRPTDWGDIEGILGSHPRLDRRRIRRCLRGFADAMDAPEIYEEMDELLAKREKPRRKGR